MSAVGRWLERARGSAWTAYGASVGLSSVLAVAALQLWKANLRVPFTYWGDALPVGAHFKTVIQQGWYESQPLLGAPAGQAYHDFPTADNLHFVAARVLSVFTSDWALAMNVYFLVGFPLAALTANWLLRRCGVSTWIGVALSAAYALAPFHFVRGESHLWLASYYTVPLTLGLVVLVLRGETLWGWAKGKTGVRRFLLSPAARTVAIVALGATASTYYSVFFLIILAAAGIYVLVRDRHARRFVGAVSAGVLTIAVMVVNMLPDLLYSWSHGGNTEALTRSRGEAEIYALKFSQLVLPWQGHRVAKLAELRQRYDSSYVPLGEPPALGFIAASGFVIALLVVGYLAVARSRKTTAMASDRGALIAGLSGMVFVAYWAASIGGLSTIFSFITDAIRGWNRMSIVIAMLGLVIVGLVIDEGIERWRTRRRPGAVRYAVVRGGVALLLVALAFLDQTPANMGSSYAGVEAAFIADEAYFHEVEAGLVPGAMVLLVPQIPFPESSSVTGQLASAQLVPYLHANSIRWTNGGIKGRPAADWPAALPAYGADRVPEFAALAGCDGILVDRSAAEDAGAELETAILDATGAAPLEDSTGRFAFYDVAMYRAAVESVLRSADLARAREQVLRPVVAYASPGLYAGLATTGEEAFVARTAAGEFSLANDGPAPRHVRVTFDVIGAPGDTASVTLPSGKTITAELAEGRWSVDEVFDVPVGTSIVGVTVNPGPAGTLGAQISRPLVIDLGLERVLSHTAQLVSTGL